MPRERLIDFFCGGGGAAKGYHDAGFEVVGVDIEPQPDYPYEFIQADAIEMLTDAFVTYGNTGFIDTFDAAHASPPCKRWTSMSHLHDIDHPDLITPLRPLLEAFGRPWVIENVPRAPLHFPVLLCGSMFDPPLDVRRHRLFETNWGLRYPDWPCRHRLWSPRFPSEDSRSTRLANVVGVYGGGRYAGSDSLRKRAMGIDWLPRDRLAQAIPPAYTEFIGRQLLEHLRVST